MESRFGVEHEEDGGARIRPLDFGDTRRALARRIVPRCQRGRGVHAKQADGGAGNAQERPRSAVTTVLHVTTSAQAGRP